MISLTELMRQPEPVICEECGAEMPAGPPICDECIKLFLEEIDREMADA